MPRLVTPSSRCRIEFYPKTASNAQISGDFVYLTSGAISKVANANVGAVAGVAIRTVAATDSDYASTTKVPVLIDEDGVWEMDGVDSGTLTVGETCDLGGTTPSTKLAADGSTYDTITVVGGTTTKPLVKIRRWQYADVGAVA